MTKRESEQLKQLAAAGFRGIGAGDLLDKPTTRDLVRSGLADNSGGSPSALSRVYITQAGRQALRKSV